MRSVHATHDLTPPPAARAPAIALQHDRHRDRARRRARPAPTSSPRLETVDAGGPPGEHHRLRLHLPRRRVRAGRAPARAPRPPRPRGRGGRGALRRRAGEAPPGATWSADVPVAARPRPHLHRVRADLEPDPHRQAVARVRRPARHHPARHRHAGPRGLARRSAHAAGPGRAGSPAIGCRFARHGAPALDDRGARDGRRAADGRVIAVRGARRRRPARAPRRRLVLAGR